MPVCSPRLLVTFVLSLTATTHTAYAASNAQLIATPLVASSVGRWDLNRPISPGRALGDLRHLSHVERPPERPRLLIPLYVSFAALQAMDAHSTMKAVDRGYVELNPLVSPSTRNGAAMAAMKVAVTASVIVGTEKLWRHNRAAAIAAIVVVNGAYAAIVAHNYRNATR
jgi:Domain of unknown function (DUF5658)